MAFGAYQTALITILQLHLSFLIVILFVSYKTPTQDMHIKLKFFVSESILLQAQPPTNNCVKMAGIQSFLEFAITVLYLLN